MYLVFKLSSNVAQEIILISVHARVPLDVETMDFYSLIVLEYYFYPLI